MVYEYVYLRGITYLTISLIDCKTGFFFLQVAINSVALLIYIIYLFIDKNLHEQNRYNVCIGCGSVVPLTPSLGAKWLVLWWAKRHPRSMQQLAR